MPILIHAAMSWAHMELLYNQQYEFCPSVFIARLETLLLRQIRYQQIRYRRIIVHVPGKERNLK